MYSALYYVCLRLQGGLGTLICNGSYNIQTITWVIFVYLITTHAIHGERIRKGKRPALPNAKTKSLILKHFVSFIVFFYFSLVAIGDRSDFMQF